MYGNEPKVDGEFLNFSIYDLDGILYKSGDEIFQEKVLLITLWGTWCPPCRSEIPTFSYLHRKYEQQGLKIIGIAFERDSSLSNRRAYLKNFVDSQNIDYLILDGGTTKDFSKTFPQITEATGLPIEIIINRSGKIAVCRNGFGYSEEWAAKLEHEIKTLLKLDK